jgi:hypothetical protein
MSIIDLPPRYNGLQPEVVQDLRFFCTLWGIHEQTYCSKHSHPKNFNPFKSLINVLKVHVTHSVFRVD